MTKEEQKSVDNLNKIIMDLKNDQKTFKDQITNLVEVINQKVEKKHTPISFEVDILKTAQLAIGESINKVLTSSYDSPLHKLVKSVVDENSTELRVIISDSFKQVIKTDEFKQSIVSAFSHKVAKTIISNNDGLFDKVSNELKQDAIFKSKMQIAVSNVVEDCLKNKNETKN